MAQLPESRRSYDHRIREIVCQTGNPRIFHHLRIPRSTTACWLSRGRRRVVSLDWQHDIASVLDENERLKRRAERQTAIIRLLVVLLKLSGFRLDEQRLPDGKAKAKVLRTVERCKDALPLKSALRLVRLSPVRYHAWKRADKRCELDDRLSCPRSHPTQLTPAEVSTIKEMVTATEYRHMPLRTLSLHAQRIGKVFASATTWAKLARQRGWRRPRRRVYPEKPKTGIRATRPNEYWHIDVTVIRLLDDTKAYLHAVIDNFSRRILSWRLSERLDPTTTCEILKEAGKHLDQAPTIIADSGVENVNAQVDQLMADGFTQLEQLIDFYVNAHNTQMPHHAFVGQTPDEVYFDHADRVPDRLTAARHQARRARMEANRRQLCRACAPRTPQSVSVINAVANAPP
jgi:transposase InsO family protein